MTRRKRWDIPCGVGPIVAALLLVSSGRLAAQQARQASPNRNVRSLSTRQPRLTRQPARTSVPPRPAALVFDSVQVIDVVTGQVRERQRVVVVGSRVQAVGPVDSVPWPAGAHAVAGAKDRYLIPGLWDMHAHVRWWAANAYPLLIANGITGIRDPGDLDQAVVPIATRRQWQREILAGRRVGPPHMLLTGQVAEPGDPAAARRLVDSLQAAGADFVKNYLTFPNEGEVATYFAMAAEARRVGLRLEGHFFRRVSLEEASDSGQRIIDHRVGLGACAEFKSVTDTVSLERCRALAQHLRRNGTWLVPTLNAGTGGAPRRYLPVEIRPGFDAYSGILEPDETFNKPFDLENWPDSLLVLARQADLPLLAGTDGQPYGFKLHKELAAFVHEGLTPLAALQAATLNPAKAYGLTDSLGTVAAGKLADLVLLKDNPLEDIRNTTHIVAVVANGRYFGEDALYQLLAEGERVVNQCPLKRSPPMTEINWKKWTKFCTK